jgi:hypothetical protein
MKQVRLLIGLAEPAKIVFLFNSSQCTFPSFETTSERRSRRRHDSF